MMRDGSKRRRVSSVHWAGGYSNLITSGCLENGITFSLQTRRSLRATDCPRSWWLHCLSFCRLVYIIVLCRTHSYQAAPECSNYKTWLSVFFMHYYSSPSRCVWFNYPPTIRDAHPAAFQIHDEDVVEYSMPLGMITEMWTAGGKNWLSGELFSGRPFN